MAAPYSNITDSSFGDGTLGPIASTYYDTRALSRLFQNLVFYNLGMKKDLPKNSGQVMQFYRYSNITGSTTTIAENAITAGATQLSASTSQITASLYGKNTVLSRFSIDTSRSRSEIEDAVDVLTDAASDTVDLVIANTLTTNLSGSTTTNLFGANGTATSATITTADTFAASVLRLAVAKFAANKVRPYSDGSKYAGIVHPYMQYSIMSDTTVGGFLTSAQYDKPEKIWNGEFGALAGVRLLMSQNIVTATVTAGVTGYANFFVGEGAFACVSLESNPIQIIVKSGGGAYDPYNNLVSVAYKLPGFGVAYLGTDGPRAYRWVLASAI